METIHNINNAFSPGTANECTVQWWFKKSCEGDESFEDKELSGRPLEDDKDQLRESLKLILLNYTGSCWRTQHRPFYSRSAFEANWKGAKLNKQLSECFISWLKIKKKISVLKCCFLLFHKTTTNHFLFSLWCGLKFIFCGCTECKCH